MVDLVNAIIDPTGGQEAALQAGGIQAGAAQAAIPLQLEAFEGAQQRLGGFEQVGQAALGSRAALAGLGGIEGQQQAFAQIAESPGQRFIRDRQQRALLRNASAIGGLGGGNVRTALQEQAAGFAAQDIGAQRQELAQLSGGGLTAGLNLAQFGIGTAGTVGDLTQSAAQARATGILGAQQAQASGVEQAIGFGTALAEIFG
jgi:hypothetical protein